MATIGFPKPVANNKKAKPAATQGIQRSGAASVFTFGALLAEDVFFEICFAIGKYRFLQAAKYAIMHNLLILTFLMKKSSLCSGASKIRAAAVVSLVFLGALALRAQYGGPRLFLDVPHVYFSAPDAENIGRRLGAGAEVAMNVGTHWSVARMGAGTTFTFDPQAEEFNKTTVWGPYALLEAGAGLYRTNGNQCAKDRASAFTAIGKVGTRYDFNKKAVPVDSPEDSPKQIDFTVGAELGYFYIRDEFRNMEVVASGNYLLNAKAFSATFGLKFFLNLRARSR